MRTLHAIFPAAFVGCLLTAPVAFAAGGEDTKLNLGGSADDSAKVAHSAGGGSIVRTILGLVVVLGVIYGLHWVLKNVKRSKEAGAAGEGLEQLATLPLGTNRALHLVRAGREIVLIGTAEQTVAPIRRYSEDEARHLGLIEAPGTVTVNATLADLEAPATDAPKGLLNTLRSRTVVR
jgi:flagellar protein FliO/FliZ